MEHAYVIGLDYGTDSVRALLVDALTGREIDSKWRSIPAGTKGFYSDPRVARFRQHPKDYLEALRQSVRAVTGRHADLAPYVRALSVDTTASTPCLTDRAGVPLSLHEEYAENPDAMFVLWKDHTGQAECEEINALCARSEINYACHSGNYYSAECFWSKVLHPAAPGRSAAARRLVGRRTVRLDSRRADGVPRRRERQDGPLRLRFETDVGRGVGRLSARKVLRRARSRAAARAASSAERQLRLRRRGRHPDRGVGLRTGASGGYSRRRGVHRFAFGSSRRRHPLRDGGAQPRHLGLLHGRHAARSDGR